MKLLKRCGLLRLRNKAVDIVCKTFMSGTSSCKNITAFFMFHITVVFMLHIAVVFMIHITVVSMIHITVVFMIHITVVFMIHMLEHAKTAVMFLHVRCRFSKVFDRSLFLHVRYRFSKVFDKPHCKSV